MLWHELSVPIGVFIELLDENEECVVAADHVVQVLL